MPASWTPDEVLDAARAFQPTCVLLAAADLDVFTVLNDEPMTAEALASRLDTNPRATGVLLDALAALGLLTKQNATYSVPADVAETLTESGSRNALPMVRHQANCLRRWVQLARVVQTGLPAERTPSIRGAAADQDAFIGAIGAPWAASQVL